MLRYSWSKLVIYAIFGVKKSNFLKLRFSMIVICHSTQNWTEIQERYRKWDVEPGVFEKIRVKGQELNDIFLGARMVPLGEGLGVRGGLDKRQPLRLQRPSCEKLYI